MAIVDATKAAACWQLYSELVLMQAVGLITKKQAKELKEELNGLFHAAMGITE